MTHVATPDMRSRARQCGAGAAPVWPAPWRTPVTVSLGATLSMLIPETTTVATPPSVAVTVRVTDCAAPLCRRVTGLGQGRVNDDPAATQWNVTVTGARYQPNALLRCALLRVAVIVGLCREVEPDEPVKSVSPA